MHRLVYQDVFKSRSRKFNLATLIKSRQNSITSEEAKLNFPVKTMGREGRQNNQRLVPAASLSNRLSQFTVGQKSTSPARLDVRTSHVREDGEKERRVAETRVEHVRIIGNTADRNLSISRTHISTSDNRVKPVRAIASVNSQLPHPACRLSASRLIESQNVRDFLLVGDFHSRRWSTMTYLPLRLHKP
ncbi:hypothetical protein RRG08_020844 [Elysia crispata]|uniref:Uncharacterized protein n=1 Tax=Elysia crispata TaxID=231223 RepID=A0AAE0XV98_9GAST|nr:hypothetical protein RRG08_020844 [Elysia crispata]